MSRFFRFSFLLVFAMAACLRAGAADRPGPPEQASADPQKPQLLPLGDDRYGLGELEIDLAERWIRVPAEVNMDRGLLEVLVCAPWGKLHEALFVCDIRPYQLQVALLLMGLEMGNDTLLLKGSPPEHFTGDSLRILFESAEGTTPVSELIRNVHAKRAMRGNAWRFSGSYFDADGRFAAEETGSLAATYYDPSAILQNPRENVFDDTFYIVDSTRVPIRGTAGVLVFDCQGKGD